MRKSREWKEEKECTVMYTYRALAELMHWPYTESKGHI